MLFNKTRAIEYMERGRVDVIVATSPVNITYFSDYYCWIDPLFREYMMAPGASSEIPQRFAVFPLEGDPALVVGPDMATNAADLWVRDLHIAGSPVIDTSLTPETLSEEDQRVLDLLQSPHRNLKPTDALLSILKARGLTESRIGIEMDGLAPSAKAELAEALPESENHGLLRSDSSCSDGQDGGGDIPTHPRRRNQRRGGDGESRFGASREDDGARYPALSGADWRGRRRSRSLHVRRETVWVSPWSATMCCGTTT